MHFFGNHTRSRLECSLALLPQRALTSPSSALLSPLRRACRTPALGSQKKPHSARITRAHAHILSSSIDSTYALSRLFPRALQPKRRDSTVNFITPKKISRQRFINEGLQSVGRITRSMTGYHNVRERRDRCRERSEGGQWNVRLHLALTFFCCSQSTHTLHAS